MPRCITHMLITDILITLSDSTLHYDFRFLPIELENYKYMMLPKFIQSVFKGVSRVS